MSNYFLLCGKNVVQVASAFAPEGAKLAHELISELDNTNVLPFQLKLIKLTDRKDGFIKSEELSDLKDIWLDYQPNSFAWPLMSAKFKSVIEKNMTGEEGIDWITAKINGNGENRDYYIPRFARMLDVLHRQKTSFVQGTDHIVRPWFSLKKINNYSIFNRPSSHNLWKITSGIYISESLKRAIGKEKLSGVYFEKIFVS